METYLVYRRQFEYFGHVDMRQLEMHSFVQLNNCFGMAVIEQGVIVVL